MKRMNRLLRLPFLCVLLSLALARVASATDALYQNFGVLNYIVPGNPPPTIDTRIFDNENLFNVGYTVYSPNVIFYEPMNTLSYTNNGTMTANAPIYTLGNFLLFQTFGAGFRFDQQTTNNLTPHLMADTFYNPGTIRCDSFLDGNNFFTFFNTQFFIVASIGQCIVSATNIVNPGTIQVGVDGLMQLSGQNVDLTRSILNMELFQNVPSSTGAVGINTNLWFPGTALRPTTAFASPPINFQLTNSTPYFDIQPVGASTLVIRAVFLQNADSNVVNNVYFDPLGFNGGDGAVNVEWAGGYTDPATCATANNYLYLTDFYVFGASTNVVIIGGVPDNYFFTTSSNQLFQNPAAPGYVNAFSLSSATNRYAYMDARLLPTTVNTNISTTNPSGALTNLPGRIQITANKELNLNFAQISGQNYLSLTATNQFSGNEGAQISSPFSDINLAVTNGFMSVTNLLLSALPTWSGSVQAWSTRWIEVVGGITNDYRVLLVRSSQMLPVTAPAVQDLRLHATNSTVISDVMNVMRTLNIDSKSLTLTTNGCGNGNGSFAGELNLSSGAILWPNSLPNLRWLTNNGSIRTLNSVNFIGTATTVTVTPMTPLTPATGMISQLGVANVANNDTVTIGATQYKFVSSLGSAANLVLIGGTFDVSLGNLIAAINHAAGSGTKYSSATVPNSQVTAGALASHAFTVTAINAGATAGAAGNSVATTTTSTHLTWNGHTTLTGGADYVAASTNSVSSSVPYGALVNTGLIQDLGSTIQANYFENSGVITNGASGSFLLLSKTAVLTNGSIFAAGDLSITADTLVASNVSLTAGRSLTLQVTNLLTDSDATNGNFWTVSSATGNNGMSLPIKPPVGDLRRTSITNIAPANRNVINLWAGKDRGVSVTGYTNNEAIGRLILNGLANNPPTTLFTFNGTSVSNAIYVDYLELQGGATNRDASYNLTMLSIKTNMVIYYAQAVISGVSVAEKINHKNNDRLRWVSAYAGNYSSTNFVYAGATNFVNAALAQSLNIDSDQDGIPNGNDATPFFGYTNVNLTMIITNVPPMKVRLAWQTIPYATNTVFYKTNFIAPWLVLTNFVTPPPPPYSPLTNVLYDLFNPAQPRYYQVLVYPNSVQFYGP